jgi:nucleotide-binding universal stress UspA family protein
MSAFVPRRQSAVNDFRQAHQQAALQQILARLTGKSVQLLSYDEVLKQLKLTGQSTRGVRAIPVDAIVGTVGRCSDFTRTFLPRQSSDEQRWADLKAFAEANSLDALPPIDVYQIGSAYFVQDGHHRVSIARQLGIFYISASVTEIQTRVPLTPDIDPDELIIEAEHAEFLEYTRLDRLRPHSDFSVSVPGQYGKLENHIEVHRYFSEVVEEHELPFDEAVCRWHDESYQPIVNAIREQGVLRDFPDRTVTDFYVWIAEHRLLLQHELGWTIPAEAATASLAMRFAAQSRPVAERASRRMLRTLIPAALKGGPVAGQWRKTKLETRYSDCLFGDVLIPISGSPLDWTAFEQAVLLAEQECSKIRGLGVVATEADRDSVATQTLRVEFGRRCAAANLLGRFHIEVGRLAALVCQRATLADLVVTRLPHSGRGIDGEIQALIRQCTRPVLAVPDRPAAFRQVLLAYDGSVKSKEALFVATYLAEVWKTALVIMTVHEHGYIDRDALTYAQKYLEIHEVEAEYVFAQGAVAGNLLKAVEVYSCDAILMGSYCSPAAVEAFIGGTVDRVLRETRVPVLICR